MEEEDAGVRAAIHADPRLSARQRQALLEVYDAFVGADTRRRRRRRAKAPDSDAQDG